MAKKSDDNSLSVIDEIENQLREVFSKKKQEVERELEERIQRQKEEAQKRIENLEKEVEEEKETLADFKKALSEFETNREEIKRQIKEHLEKAIQFQTGIEDLTGKTLEELKIVSKLNQRFEELSQKTGLKITSLKKDLEERFGIIAEVPEGTVLDEEEINLERELSKIRKIKELLSSGNMIEEETESSEEAKAEEEKTEQEFREEVSEQEAKKESKEGNRAEDKIETEETEEGQEEKITEEIKEQFEEDLSVEKKPDSDQVTEAVEGEVKEKSFQDLFERLDHFRKGPKDGNDEEISYFEHNEKIVLDGEFLIATLNDSFDEAKKLYMKLSQIESPKDQFFTKQEIIKHQDNLRKVVLKSLRMCEKENCSLPAFTSEVLNINVLKDILERVSMQNWSNNDDFVSFENFAQGIKDAFYTRITPPADYLRSILEQLGAEESNS